MPATLTFDAHRVEVSVASFFTSPVQPEQDAKSLISVARALAFAISI